MSKGENETAQLREGTRVLVHGEAAYLWIHEYDGLVFFNGHSHADTKAEGQEGPGISGYAGREMECGRICTPHRTQNCQTDIRKGG